MSVDVAPPAQRHAKGRHAGSRHAAAKRRRRWPWYALGALTLLVVIGVASLLWYVSGRIADVARGDEGASVFPIEVTSVEGPTISYRGSTEGWPDEGLMGMATVEGGYVQTDEPIAVGRGDAASGTRRVTAAALQPAPSSGDQAAMDGWYFPRNPKVALGLDYQDVEYDTPLGPTSAWLIPGKSNTWVIFTHGAGATPREGLRIASTTAALGYPTMLIRYRNDAQQPQGNGYGQFGADEWQDLEAAVKFAVARGADRVVLSGVGMGGAITMGFLQSSPLADRVAGAFLDSPALDFSEVIQTEAADIGVPSLVTSMAMPLASRRFGFDWERTDYTKDAAGFTTPTLIVQGTEDDVVPSRVSSAFASAADPSVVRLELFEGAGHDLSWNVDRPRYQRVLTEFLGRVAPAG